MKISSYVHRKQLKSVTKEMIKNEPCGAFFDAVYLKKNMLK